MRRKSSASARARLIGLTSLASAFSLATTPISSRPGRTVHAPRQGDAGHPYDGHNFQVTVIPEIETRQIGANLSRIVADRGYRGHNAPPDRAFKVYIFWLKTPPHRDDQTRISPPLGGRTGHRTLAKAEHRMGRNPSRRVQRRRSQRRPRRSRLQLPPAPRMAGRLLARLRHGHPRRRSRRSDPLARLSLEVHQKAPPLQTPRSSRATNSRSSPTIETLRARQATHRPLEGRPPRDRGRSL